MFNSSIGLFHTLFAVTSIIFGALVLISRKATLKHKRLGYGFFSSMVLMNITALFTQSIYVFGPFHYMALGSLTFVCCGIAAPLFFRSHANWLRIHYDFMLWSYVGLIAAMFSEIMVRLPIVGRVIGGGTLFWILVVAASLITFLVGGYFIVRHSKKALPFRNKSIKEQAT